MKFTIGERLGLLTILPEESTILTMLIREGLKEAAGLNEEELAEKVETLEDGRIKWDPQHLKEIEIGPAAREIITGLIKDLDARGKITELALLVHKKFAAPEH